jgi:hypothetical protein
MKECRPVDISNGAFNFCKYTIALSLWVSILFQSKILVVMCFVILLISAIVKVKNAPLVFLYTYTLDKLRPSKRIILDERAIAFAHTVGAVLSGIALIFIYFISPLTGWIITGILALLKTSGALGYCGAAKLYGCLNNPNGQCCRTGKRIRKYKSSLQ